MPLGAFRLGIHMAVKSASRQLVGTFDGSRFFVQGGEHIRKYRRLRDTDQEEHFETAGQI
jgi:hypothetical protein